MNDNVSKNHAHTLQAKIQQTAVFLVTGQLILQCSAMKKQIVWLEQFLQSMIGLPPAVKKNCFQLFG